MPKTVFLDTEEGKGHIEVEYEWIPPTCNKCKSFGHWISNVPQRKFRFQKIIQFLHQMLIFINILVKKSNLEVMVGRTPQKRMHRDE